MDESRLRYERDRGLSFLRNSIEAEDNPFSSEISLDGSSPRRILVRRASSDASLLRGVTRPLWRQITEGSKRMVVGSGSQAGFS